MTFQTSKLLKTVPKKAKNMTSFPCSVRPEKFHPYVPFLALSGGQNGWIWLKFRNWAKILKFGQILRILKKNCLKIYYLNIFHLKIFHWIHLQRGGCHIRNEDSDCRIFEKATVTLARRLSTRVDRRSQTCEKQTNPSNIVYLIGVKERLQQFFLLKNFAFPLPRTCTSVARFWEAILPIYMNVKVFMALFTKFHQISLNFTKFGNVIYS